jgi:hypothetical protein
MNNNERLSLSGSEITVAGIVGIAMSWLVMSISVLMGMSDDPYWIDPSLFWQKLGLAMFLLSFFVLTFQFKMVRYLLVFGGIYLSLSVVVLTFNAIVFTALIAIAFKVLTSIIARR